EGQDGSDVCRLAAELTRAVDGTLAIACVLRSHETNRESFAQRKLETLRGELAEHAIDLRTTQLFGPLDEALKDYVDTHHVDLVVLHNGHKHDALLLHNLGCPAMVVGDDSEGLRQALAGQHRLRVLVAVDRSEASDAPIGWLGRLRSRVPCDI